MKRLYKKHLHRSILILYYFYTVHFSDFNQSEQMFFLENQVTPQRNTMVVNRKWRLRHSGGVLDNWHSAVIQNYIVAKM